MVAFNIHFLPTILIYFSTLWMQPSPTNPDSTITFDHYTYKTIHLENGQRWMAENLRSSIYANGDSVINPTDLEALMELNTKVPESTLSDSLRGEISSGTNISSPAKATVSAKLTLMVCACTCRYGPIAAQSPTKSRPSSSSKVRYFFWLNA